MRAAGRTVFRPEPAEAFWFWFSGAQDTDPSHLGDGRGRSRSSFFLPMSNSPPPAIPPGSIPKDAPNLDCAIPESRFEAI
jgi:hypothetical protein